MRVTRAVHRPFTLGRGIESLWLHNFVATKDRVGGNPTVKYAGRLAAVAVVGALSLAACGTDNNSGADATASAGAGPPLGRGEPWIMDTYSVNTGYSVPGVVPGNPLTLGGSLGRTGSTSRGVQIAAMCALGRSP